MSHQLWLDIQGELKKRDDAIASFKEELRFITNRLIKVEQKLRDDHLKKYIKDAVKE